MFIDSHAHFDLCMEKRETTEEALLRDMAVKGVSHAVHVCIDHEGLAWAQKFAERNTDMFFTLGIHPSSKAGEAEQKLLSGAVKKTMGSGIGRRLWGIGETGLDFYRMHQPEEMQRQSFEYQIRLAKEWGLPVIVHSRDAMEATLEILRAARPPSGVMHCFSGNADAARKVLDLGFTLSFAGNLTYPKARDLQEAAAYAPLDRLLLETDAPFLTPVPLRGRPNRPSYVAHIYKFLADLKKTGLSAVEDALHKSFMKLAAGTVS